MYKPVAYSPVTSIYAAIGAGDTIITVNNGALLGDAPNIAVIGKTASSSETIVYGVKNGNILSNVQRGVQGIAKSWSVGDQIARNFTALDQSNIQDNINALNADKVEKTGDGMTGRLYIKSTGGPISTTSGIGQVEVQDGGDVNTASAITFHREGSFACNLGIDTDNILKLGGWTMGNVAYKLWHEGNDGYGSGLDADMIRGMYPSFNPYLSYIPVVNSGRTMDIGDLIDFHFPGSSTDYDIRLSVSSEGNYFYIYLAGGGTYRFLDTRDLSNGVIAEYGTWTPTLFGSTTAGSFNYNGQLGEYMRMGSYVFITAFIDASETLAPSGIIRVSGVPFPSLSIHALNVSYAENWSYPETSAFISNAGTNRTSITLMAGNKGTLTSDSGNYPKMIISGWYKIEKFDNEICIDEKGTKYSIDSITECGSFSLLKVNQNGSLHRCTYTPNNDISDLPIDLQTQIRGIWTPDVLAAFDQMLKAESKQYEERQSTIEKNTLDLEARLSRIEAAIESLLTAQVRK